MTRYSPSQLRNMADVSSENAMPVLAAMLRQAADDAEDADRLRFVIENRLSLNPVLTSSWEILSLDANLRPKDGYEGDDVRDLIDATRTPKEQKK
jgi:hypothetical protein